MIVQNNIRKHWGTKLVEYFISFSATTHQIKYLLIFQVPFTTVFFLSFFGETFYCFWLICYWLYPDNLFCDVNLRTWLSRHFLWNSLSLSSIKVSLIDQSAKYFFKSLSNWYHNCFVPLLLQLYHPLALLLITTSTVQHVYNERL